MVERHISDVEGDGSSVGEAKEKANQTEEAAILAEQVILRLRKAVEKLTTADPRAGREAAKSLRALALFVRGVSLNSSQASFRARRELERILEKGEKPQH